MRACFQAQLHYAAKAEAVSSVKSQLVQREREAQALKEQLEKVQLQHRALQERVKARTER